MPRDLATDANDNLRSVVVRLAEELPAGAHRTFGPLTAAAAGVPVPIFNRVFVFDAPPAADLTAAVDWIAEREVTFWVTATDRAVEAVEIHCPDLDRDLAKATEQPGMAMASLDEIPARTSVAEIREVTDPDELADFSGVAASIFDIPLDVERRVDRAALAMDDVRPFLGRVEGDPAACGLLARSGDVAGVYTIGVVEEFRRRGIGKAMSWEVLRAGRDAGCRVGVLQSSEMAVPLYEEMGFETVTTYHLFEPAA